MHFVLTPMRSEKKKEEKEQSASNWCWDVSLILEKKEGNKLLFKVESSLLSYVLCLKA